MIPQEEIRRYLPKYLSPESYEELISELKSFPENLDKRFYSSMDFPYLCQGDIVKNLPIVDCGNIERKIKYRNAIVLSNTCDVDLNNIRCYSSRIVYSPLIELDTFIEVLQKKGIQREKISTLVDNIKQQKITQIVFLPSFGSVKDSIVFLDGVLNVDAEYIKREDLSTIRLAGLSNYGFYLLLFKLSVHFSRMQEKLDRFSLNR